MILMFLFAVNYMYANTVFAEPKPTIIEPRKIILSIKSEDAKHIHSAITNAVNVLKVYGPEQVNMKIVFYSGAVKGLTKKEKDIAARIIALMDLDVIFIACSNAMRSKNIDEKELIDDVEIVTSGIVEIVERVKEGWVYIAP